MYIEGLMVNLLTIQPYIATPNDIKQTSDRL